MPSLVGRVPSLAVAAIRSGGAILRGMPSLWDAILRRVKGASVKGREFHEGDAMKGVPRTGCHEGGCHEGGPMKGLL